MARLAFLLALHGLTSLQSASGASVPVSSKPYCPVFSTDKQPANCQPAPSSFLNFTQSTTAQGKKGDTQPLEDAFNALSVLQNNYFDAQNHTWSTAIDWTAAVIGTGIAGMLSTLTTSLDAIEAGNGDWQSKENLINFFYDQIAASYFGQDAIAVTGEAYDDINWVVLQWLEAIRFVDKHAALHYSATKRSTDCKKSPGSIKQALSNLSWHGYTWVCSFAHRTRLFYDNGIKGWDDYWCGGGTTWNPRLLLYKNAITNELYIASSVSMYRFFPGDKFSGNEVLNKRANTNPSYLENAIKGYKWITHVNFTNSQGLYTDGFHVNMGIPGNTKCDQRDEMVYTYNQGVLLTGNRGLWEVTGAPSYLDEGHQLIQNVIAATGWILNGEKTMDDISRVQYDSLPPWRGLGRGGILEDQCDASATCSQDSQTFKGIFFHHFTEFCAPLDAASTKTGFTVDASAYSRVQSAHANACSAYLPWVKHNADAALKTRDGGGRFGMWWGANIFQNTLVSVAADGINHTLANVTDYRNEGTPLNDIWGTNATWTPGISGGGLAAPRGNAQRSIASRGADPNDRGRGRTVETQSGGLALLRAYWELSRQ